MQWLIVQSIALKLQDRICETSLKTVRFSNSATLQEWDGTKFLFSSIPLLIFFIAEAGEKL